MGVSYERGTPVAIPEARVVMMSGAWLVVADGDLLVGGVPLVVEDA